MRDDDETYGGSGEDWDDPLDDSEDATEACPYCRRDIYADAVRCPYCEQYISEEDSPSSPQPRWFVITAVLCLIMVAFWILWF